MTMEHSLKHADFGQIKNISRNLVYIEIFLPAQFGDKRPTDGAESQRRQTDCELWREAGDTATRGPPIVLLGVRHPCQDTARSSCGPEVLQTRSHFKTGQGLAHLRSPRLLCVRSLGSPWYDYVYFNIASSGIQ